MKTITEIQFEIIIGMLNSNPKLYERLKSYMLLEAPVQILTEEPPEIEGYKE